MQCFSHNNIEPATSAAVTTNPACYKAVELQSPTTSAVGEDHLYEHVELMPITTQQMKEIEVAPNPAYGTVHI